MTTREFDAAPLHNLRLSLVPAPAGVRKYHPKVIREFSHGLSLVDELCPEISSVAGSSFDVSMYDKTYIKCP